MKLEPGVYLLALIAGGCMFLGGYALAEQEQLIALLAALSGGAFILGALHRAQRPLSPPEV